MRLAVLLHTSAACCCSRFVLKSLNLLSALTFEYLERNAASSSRPSQRVSIYLLNALISIMGSTTASLAWSIPVPADILAAHLDAYKSLHDREIKSLRLCHRFGRGEKAVLPRLPVEVVALIEDSLMQDARREALDYNYEQAFRCWEGKCRPREHMMDAEFAEAYIPRLGPYECKDCGCEIRRSAREECGCGRCPSGIHPLPDGSMTPLDNLLRADHSRRSKGEWYENHRENAADWRFVVSGHRDDPGIFARHQHMMSRDFDLRLWWSHMQIYPTPGNAITLTNYDGQHWSTTAHVVLPNAGSESHFERVTWDGDDGIFAVAASNECGRAFDAAIPGAVSKKDLAKLHRAFTTLGLVPTTGDAALPISTSPTSGGRKSQSAATEQGARRTKDDKPEPWIPKLRLLLKTQLDGF